MTEVTFQVVKEMDVVRVKLTAEGEARLKRLLPENKCLGCECVHPPGSKVVCGCCASCDQSQRYAMRKGMVTLRELIRAGERAVRTSGGRKPASAYVARLLGREGDYRGVRDSRAS